MFTEGDAIFAVGTTSAVLTSTCDPRGCTDTCTISKRDGVCSTRVHYQTAQAWQRRLLRLFELSYACKKSGSLCSCTGRPRSPAVTSFGRLHRCLIILT